MMLMREMERTTVTFPRELARRLRMEAQRTGRPVSAVVRDAVRAYLDRRGAPPLPSFAGAGRSGRGDVSERAEELVGRRVRRRPR
jgi:predicted transcriptional regulator